MKVLNIAEGLHERLVSREFCKWSLSSLELRVSAMSVHERGLLLLLLLFLSLL